MNELKKYIEQAENELAEGSRGRQYILEDLVDKVLEMVNVKIQNMFSYELNGETLISKYELLDEVKEIVK